MNENDEYDWGKFYSNLHSSHHFISVELISLLRKTISTFLFCFVSFHLFGFEETLSQGRPKDTPTQRNIFFEFQTFRIVLEKRDVARSDFVKKY